MSLTMKLIKPSYPTPKNRRTFNLSFFSYIPLRTYVPLIYFYPANGSVEATKNSKKREQLQNSLSEILTIFYPLAGRLNDDRLSVDCQDQGVLYVETKVNFHLSEYLNETYENLDLLTHVNILTLEMGKDEAVTSMKPLLGVQVTMFKCGGLALALTISHIVADGYTSVSFINEWGKMCRLGFSDAKTSLNFDVASTYPARDVLEVLKPTPLGKTVAEIVGKKFLFDRAAISRLKEKVKADSPGMKFRLSRVVVVTALIWKGIICAAQAREGYLKPTILSISVNLRGKISTLESENAFGNFFMIVPIKFMPIDNKVELHDIAYLIADKVQKTLQECVKLSSDDLSSKLIAFRNEISDARANSEMNVNASTSLCGMPVYEADFGWGKPSWATSTKGRFDITLIDTKCGTGIEATVCQNAIDMLTLLHDPDIAEFICKPKAKL